MSAPQAALAITVVLVVAGQARAQEATEATKPAPAAPTEGEADPASLAPADVNEQGQRDEPDDASASEAAPLPPSPAVESTDAAPPHEEAAAKEARTPPTPPPASPMRVLVLDLDTNDVEASAAELLVASLVEALARRRGLEIISTADLKALAELEAERQAAGCETKSCLAEIAGAMGANYVVFGSLHRVDEVLVATLSLFDAERAEPVARRTLQGDSVAELVASSERAADSLLAPLGFAPMAPNDDVDPLLPVGAGAVVVGALLIAAGAGAAVWSAVIRQDPNGSRELKDMAGLALPGGSVTAALGTAGALVGAGVVVWAVVE